MSTRLCVLGPSGRMGRMVLELAAEDPAIEVVSALDRAGTDLVGREVAPGVLATADAHAALGAADVYIDFTTPAATAAAARVALEHGVAAVVGTTGMDDDCERALAALAEKAPVLAAPNFSLGVNVLLGLAEQAARALGAGFDLEVVELHHRRKRDAPSGTAIALGQALARGRGLDYDQARRACEVGPRSDDQIGVVAVRGGDIIGEHTAYLIGELERIEISHRAGSRAIFAAGALRAAAWLAGKPAGRYGMRDVLGL